MASIQGRRNKEGKLISFCIRVHKGRDPITHKQLKPYIMTWSVPEGWSEKRARREAEKEAILFEMRCKEGYKLDNRQTFANYANYVMELKENEGLKHLTLVRYQQDLKRILPMIGHLKLNEIRPQHLNQLYMQLSAPGARDKGKLAIARPFLLRLLKEKAIGCRLVEKTGTMINMERVKKGKLIRISLAQRISKTLDYPFSRLFRIVEDERPLSNQSIMGCHMLISTILGQAEKEMLIPFNPAHRATVPRLADENPGCLPMKEIPRILEALNTETIKWKTLVHLLLVSGCRRGEILGLKWEKIDWDSEQICIDCSLLYSGERGLFEDKPKTKESIRYIRLPEEMMNLFMTYQKFQMEEKERYGDKWQDSPYVFTNEKGGAMNPSQLSNWLNRFSERHNLPHLNPHIFRHTMTSLLFFHGVDGVSISHRLGHAHVSTTVNIYSHVIEQAEARMSTCVANVLLAVKE